MAEDLATGLLQGFRAGFTGVPQWKRDEERAAVERKKQEADIMNRYHEAQTRKLDAEVSGAGGPAIGKYNPRDYTPESWTKFIATKDPAVLKRFAPAKNVMIGGVPHSFDPASQAYVPAAVDGKKVTAQGVGQSAGVIKGAEQQAVSDVKLRMDPKIKRAVDSVVAETKLEADKNIESYESGKALKVWELGLKGLENALAGTDTGLLTGWLPAITENQRKSDGAIAAMAPILKDVFRSAGEGTFTKDDQEILMAMLPNRSDAPGVRAAKIANVNTIVLQKLGGGDTNPKTTSAPATGGFKVLKVTP